MRCVVYRVGWLPCLVGALPIVIANRSVGDVHSLPGACPDGGTPSGREFPINRHGDGPKMIVTAGSRPVKLEARAAS